MNLIKQQPDVDKIHLYIYPFESKYQLLINWREKVRIKCGKKNIKTVIDYCQTIDVHENLEDYNLVKKRLIKKRLIAFAYMTTDKKANKKLKLIVAEMFMVQKTGHFTCFISQSYFKVPKDIRLNLTHLFIIKIPNKREL